MVATKRSVKIYELSLERKMNADYMHKSDDFPELGRPIIAIIPDIVTASPLRNPKAKSLQAPPIFLQQVLFSPDRVRAFRR